MALLSLDYFRCEPFELNFRLYVFGGFWPLETNVKWKQILFSVFSFFCYFAFTSLAAIQTVDLYLLRNDFVKLTADLCSIAIAMTITTKSLLISWKIDKINKLKEKFTKFKNTRTDEKDIEILNKSNKVILMMVKTFFGLTLPCCVFWMLYPALDSEEKRVPFPYRLPMEVWPPSVYITVYIFQSMTMIGFAINTIAVDMIFLAFVLRIIAHYDIVIKNIKALGELNDDVFDEEEMEVETKLAKKVIKENVELHKEILKDLKTFQEIYNSMCIVHFIGVVVLTGVAIIDFVRIAKGLRLQLFQKCLYMSVTLWDTFLYCFWAEIMQQKSLELTEAAYGAKWYNMKSEVGKDLLLISLRCQRVPKIQAGDLINLNLKTFLGILKIIYDITTLLFQTTKE